MKRLFTVLLILFLSLTLCNVATATEITKPDVSAEELLSNKNVNENAKVIYKSVIRLKDLRNDKTSMSFFDEEPGFNVGGVWLLSNGSAAIWAAGERAREITSAIDKLPEKLNPETKDMVSLAYAEFVQIDISPFIKGQEAMLTLSEMPASPNDDVQIGIRDQAKKTVPENEKNMNDLQNIKWNRVIDLVLGPKWYEQILTPKGLATLLLGGAGAAWLAMYLFKKMIAKKVAMAANGAKPDLRGIASSIENFGQEVNAEAAEIQQNDTNYVPEEKGDLRTRLRNWFWSSDRFWYKYAEELDGLFGIPNEISPKTLIDTTIEQVSDKVEEEATPPSGTPADGIKYGPFSFRWLRGWKDIIHFYDKW